MKFIISSFSVLFIISCYSIQTTPTDPSLLNKPFIYVFDVPSQKKDNIYINAWSWAVATFKDSKEVIKLNDKENGKIIGTGISSVKTEGKLYQNYFFYNFIVDIKDFKVRIQFDSILPHETQQVYFMDPSTTIPIAGADMKRQDHYDLINSHFKYLSHDFNKFITNRNADSNW